MAKCPLPSAERLRQVLSYYPATGLLMWKKRADVSQRWNSRYAETIAGAPDGSGYIQIKLDDRPHLAHRLAWVIYYGEWPDIIDHIDGNPRNNRISNLRSVSRLVNQRNQKRHRSNTSGRTGVRFNITRQLWTAQIKVGPKTTYLGSFVRKSDAINARKEAERSLDFTGRQ